MKHIQSYLLKKYYYVPFMVLLNIVLTTSCHQKTEKETKSNVSKPVTSIKGKLLNPTVFEIEAKVNDSSFQIDINADSTFSLTLDQLKRPTEVQFLYNDLLFNIYVTPESKTEFTANMDQYFQTVKFKGDNTVANNYLVQKFITEASLPSIYDLAALNEIDFLAKIDSIKSTKTKLLNSYSKGIANDSFLKTAKGNIIYTWANELLTYQNLRIKNVGFPSDTIQSVLNKIPLNEPQYLNSFRFNNFVFDQIQKTVKSQLATMTFIAEQADSITLAMSLEVAKNLIQNTEVKQAVYSDIINYYISSLKSGTAEYFVNTYKSQLNQKKLTSINRKIALLKPMAVGSIAPYFNLLNENGKNLSLDDLNGKVVYIDFWASWCAPCLKELPDIKKLEEEFQDLPIIFVGISLDEEIDTWKETLRKKGFSGIQLYGGGPNSKIAEDYLIKSIPHYVLLDDFGTIIHANAGRPSINARSQIESALEKIIY